MILVFTSVSEHFENIASTLVLHFIMIRMRVTTYFLCACNSHVITWTKLCTVTCMHDCINSFQDYQPPSSEYDYAH